MADEGRLHGGRNTGLAAMDELAAAAAESLMDTHSDVEEQMESTAALEDHEDDPAVPQAPEHSTMENADHEVDAVLGDVGDANHKVSTAP